MILARLYNLKLKSILSEIEHLHWHEAVIYTCILIDEFHIRGASHSHLILAVIVILGDILPLNFIRTDPSGRHTTYYSEQRKKETSGN